MLQLFVAWLSLSSYNTVLPPVQTFKIVNSLSLGTIFYHNEKGGKGKISSFDLVSYFLSLLKVTIC